MKTWFISDLHLDIHRPEIIQLFLEFLEQIKPQADALYILGDLFEYWVGDDMLELPTFKPFSAVISKLNELNQAGVDLYFIAGNRDFLIGDDFAKKTGCQLLPDHYLIQLYGKATLIMHGDTLCTDDIEYQKLRTMLRSENWQKTFLNLSIEERIQQAQELRDTSKKETIAKQAYILDVNQTAVENIMQEHHVTQLIHGHTHRMASHSFLLNKQTAKRIVLGDWHDAAHFLAVDNDRYILH